MTFGWAFRFMPRDGSFRICIRHYLGEVLQIKRKRAVGRSRPSGIIDIAIMQSLNSGGEVKEQVKNYGMVIVDECHHVPAFSFEQILKGVHAKYVYGLTATPTRQDGHHPIIFMHCGPIRYRVDARKQAEKRPFDHYVIPRLTNLRALPEEEGKEPSIQRLYTAIAVNEPRNQRIVVDWSNNLNLFRQGSANGIYGMGSF